MIQKSGERREGRGEEREREREERRQTPTAHSEDAHRTQNAVSPSQDKGSKAF
jgi:hypothetical protein